MLGHLRQENLHAKPCLIKLEIEFHTLRGFKHGMLMGMDAITDFGIDLMMSEKKAYAEKFSYNIEYENNRCKSVLIRLQESLTVPSRTCIAILMKLWMESGYDYIFTPSQFMREGGPLIPSISLPYAMINTGTWALMFQNSFNHPIHLKHGQILGYADTNGPIWTVDSREYIDWKDLVQPGPRRKSPGLSTPRYVSSEFYTANVAGGKHQSLEQCLNFLAEMVMEAN